MNIFIVKQDNVSWEEVFSEKYDELKNGCYIVSSYFSGAGKTTFCKNLANFLHNKNNKVLYIDTDVKNSIKDDSDVLFDRLVLTTGQVNEKSIRELILENPYDYIIIDTSPISLPFSIINQIEDISEICSEYFYIINGIKELVDWRATKIVLNDIDNFNKARRGKHIHRF